jgi:hypothetical protein
VESTGGAIELVVEHHKQGIIGRRVSTSYCLRYWKHGMKCNNKNRFGKFVFIYPTMVHLMMGRHTKS